MTDSSATWMPFLAAVLLAAGARQERGLYRSSVVGTDFDFIQESDPDAFDRLEYRGEGLPEMPDKRGGAPLRRKAFLFVARFTDWRRARRGSRSSKRP